MPGKREDILELNIAKFLILKRLKRMFLLLPIEIGELSSKKIQEMLVGCVQDMLDKFSSKFNADNNHKGRVKGA